MPRKQTWVQKLLADPARCPFCGGDALDAGKPTLAVHDDWYESNVRCLHCKKTWVEQLGVVNARLPGGDS